MRDDAQLLRGYVAGSEADFAAFVERHLPFVYNTALRRTGGDPHRAEEIAQQVFTDAARRARRLADHPALAGWFHVATRNAAINLARADQRRRQREDEARRMSTLDQETLPWSQLQPVIDAALDELKPADRDAVLARYFDGRSFTAIGEQLHLSENAARMRVDRAVGRLRGTLRRHGVTSTATALGAALSQQAGAAVPPGMAASISGAATAAASTFATPLASLAMNKVQTSLLAVVLAALLAPPLLQLHANRALRSEIATLQSEQVNLTAENSRLARELAEVPLASPADTDELTRLRARSATLRARPDGVLDSEMLPPSDKGWATPADAFETIVCAMQRGDWEAIAPTINYSVAGKAAADAFFATLPAAVRDQYGTAERFFAHAWSETLRRSPEERFDAMQVFETKYVEGTAPLSVRCWARNHAGNEFLVEARFEHQHQRYVPGTALCDSVMRRLSNKIDPTTGEFRKSSRSGSGR